MSFSTNQSQQISLFDATENLTDREKRLLEKSWAKYFAENIFPEIEEEPFSVLYSDRPSRHNTPVNVIIGALILKEIFGLDDVNALPIAYNIAWYEQKAVIVLLALLYLGVKNIHLGPTLPGFLSPNVAKVLVENFGIAGIGTVQDDINLFMGN